VCRFSLFASQWRPTLRVIGEPTKINLENTANISHGAKVRLSLAFEKRGQRFRSDVGRACNGMPVVKFQESSQFFRNRHLQLQVYTVFLHGYTALSIETLEFSRVFSGHVRSDHEIC
jgi:hypothetical protein